MVVDCKSRAALFYLSWVGGSANFELQESMFRMFAQADTHHPIPQRPEEASASQFTHESLGNVQNQLLLVGRHAFIHTGPARLSWHVLTAQFAYLKLQQASTSLVRVCGHLFGHDWLVGSLGSSKSRLWSCVSCLPPTGMGEAPVPDLKGSEALDPIWSTNTQTSLNP